ncbi:hypothetical protein SCORR_v1c06510 [Spiroplasma corruscae]|uniref:Lipoprotein n=1 Tax=Spiroplasma corruscae TaxID=216934 RepID=A0A222EQB9_9MOLU|nr:hypothetical protein [Spiroplasma corruscae]ASP28423.1 hypothetical protein SCORR_v1c06510 [Spiroplasma corruscae]
MKKILSILLSFGLLVTSNSLLSNVVSCGDSSFIKELSYNNGKSDRDVISILTDAKILYINSESNKLSISSDNKLDEDYKDSENQGINPFGIDGLVIDGALILPKDYQKNTNPFVKELKEIFDETINLNGLESEKEGSVLNLYVFSIKGNKGDSKFNINVTNLYIENTIDSNKVKTSWTTKELYYKTVSLV